MYRSALVCLMGLGVIVAAARCGTSVVEEQPALITEQSALAGTWQATGSMPQARRYHAATVLGSGRVLVTGGWNNSSAYLASAVVYDPAVGTWSSTGSMAVARQAHVAVLLPTGKVLVAGGEINGAHTGTAEVYDPAAGSWTAAGSLSQARAYAGATVLPSGKVLVVGGMTPGGPQRTVDVYDPGTGTWSVGAQLLTGRRSHTVTVLGNGKVLVVGGATGAATQTAELYDPATNTWSATGSLSTARYDHTATLLPSGKVLVVGGRNSGGALASAELYDPAAGTWSAGGTMAGARTFHTATLVGSKVVVAGGEAGSPASRLASVEEYDATAGTWTTTGSMIGARSLHVAALLSASNQVLVAGGQAGSLLATAELYDAANPCLNTYYRDADGDGYGTSAVSTQACTAPAGYVSNSTDCNDASSSVNPGAAEACNSVDDNCNGSIDEGAGNFYYQDADGDGYGNGSSGIRSCWAPAGYVSDSSDCNDTDSGMNPAAGEVCDGVDENCNGFVDDGAGDFYYRDADWDGYGNWANSIQACSAPPGYVANTADCNDYDPSLPRYFSQDYDGDGYGDIAVFGPPPFGCVPPPGYSYTSNDCNDHNYSVHPGATEVCNGADDNCSGAVDEWCVP
jgi:N-acetylneuraminic acid mutarotase